MLFQIGKQARNSLTLMYISRVSLTNGYKMIILFSFMYAETIAALSKYFQLFHF